MPEPASTRFESYGRKVDGQLPRMEEELRRVISYLNDEVVPEVRASSSKALRIAAEKLQAMAEHLDSRRSDAGGN